MAEGTTLVDLLDRAAAEHPDRPAWTFDLPDGREQLTFAAVADRSRRLASALSARGVGPGDRVGVMLGNTPEMPPTWLALMRLGAAMVPSTPATGATTSPTCSPTPRSASWWPGPSTTGC